MSKSVRLADYLYAQVEELAAAEKRSLANMVQVLLEQALKMETHNVTADSQPRDVVTRSVSPDVKTDFK